jgi:hypothetical protein
MAVPAIDKGARILLAQEIRSARGGHYTFTVRASAGSVAADAFESVFLANFTCRLVLFRFPDSNKDPRTMQVLASAEFKPIFGDDKTSKPYTVERFLGSTVPNANFPIGNGLGVAVVIEKTSPGTLKFDNAAPHQAFLRLHSVALTFSARPRDETVVD